jgi:hypothetical protein
VIRIGLLGTDAFANNIGLVLRGYGRHQVLRWTGSISPAAYGVLDDPKDEAVNPDRETRELLAAQGPLPSHEDLKTIMQYSDIALVTDTAHLGQRLRQLAVYVHSAGREPLPVIVASNRHNLLRVVRRDSLTAATLRLKADHPRLASDLLDQTRLLVTTADTGMVSLVERIWRPVTNKIPVEMNGRDPCTLIR